MRIMYVVETNIFSDSENETIKCKHLKSVSPGNFSSHEITWLMALKEFAML